MPTGTVLIIDDEEKLRSLLGRIIRLEGFIVFEVPTLKAGIQVMEKENIDVLLCDVRLPDGNGVDFVSHCREKFPAVEIILLTAYGNIPDGIQAIRNGAFDYITKGDDNDRVIPLVNRAMEKLQLQKKLTRLEDQVGKKYSFDNILGQSTAITDAIALAKKVAPTDATVLLLGETGTGKEVFAQAIHYGSRRNVKPFVALNCSAFTKDLLESEIFGHKAGAFTGAVKDKKGLMEEASTGTLFLDEIGEMPLELQSKLLRVLESAEFIKVGDTKTTRVDVRIIAATNRDLRKDVDDAKFREDLYYRINTFTISVPPLRDRKDDIPLLADYFVKLYARKTGIAVAGIGNSFLDKLQQHEWKGNIRELKNVIERAVILSEGGQLGAASLPHEMHNPGKDGATPAFDLASVEKLHILRVLRHTGGNKTEAAKLLNIGLTTLYRKIDEYKL